MRSRLELRIGGIPNAPREAPCSGKSAPDRRLIRRPDRAGSARRDDEAGDHEPGEERIDRRPCGEAQRRAALTPRRQSRHRN